MEERDFFDERAEQRTHVMTCPHCGQQGEYQIDWVVRRKKAQLPRGADDRDRARFAKAQSYMVRRGHPLGGKNGRCPERFDVVGVQSGGVLCFEGSRRGEGWLPCLSLRPEASF